MTRTSMRYAAACCVASTLGLGAGAARAQETTGAQFLDGIGETALVARYLFAGDAQDWSRNQYHATVHQAPTPFVEDATFGRVLALPGRDGAHVALPGEALIGVDSVSVAGWIFLRSDAPWQRFFDFGQGTQAYLFCTPVDAEADGQLRARITRAGWNAEQGPAAPRVALRQWTHVAIVLDAANKTLTAYVNGRAQASERDVALTLEDVLHQDEAERNHLRLGKSAFDHDPALDALLHDVRLYSVALSDDQVATIYANGLPGDANEQAAMRPGDADDVPGTTADASGWAERLEAIPDVEVETVAGTLPRLPLQVPAVYRDGGSGPEVRVIWPAPADNAQVRTPGRYVVTGSVPGTQLQPQAIVTVVAPPTAAPEGPQRMLETFPLGDVTLTADAAGRATAFQRNRDKFVQGLLATDPNAFLYMFRDAFGQPQPPGAQPLGGWDSQTTRLRGHATGHYLSAIAQAYASSRYDPQLQAAFKAKMDAMVGGLYQLAQLSGKPATAGGPANADPTRVPPGPGKSGYDSDLSVEGIRTDYWNWGEGFVSAYPPDQFIMLEQGATYGGGNDQIWAPYYTLHKILAGLMDCYEAGGSEQALEIAQGMGLWVHARLSRVPDATRIRMWNRYIAGEYGGMNEAMARLYRLTEDARFLECAKLFDNIDFFFGNAAREHGLARNVDTLRGKHANQHIPQITGALETFRSTHDVQYYHVAENFWHRCTGSYMYSIGGVAGASTPNNAECFTAEPDSLFRNGFSPGGQNETCATYNLLKLSRQLFLYDPQGAYMDYYEQALYNHILASVDEDNPGNTYHVPLNPGARKRFGNAAMDGFTCCNGTALESSTKLQDSIYFRSADNASLYVNLYVPSALRWTERDVVVTQSTNFPYEDRIKLTIEGDGEFSVHLRVPGWARHGFAASVNGEPQTIDARRGSYAELRRQWKSGDVIELRIPLGFWLHRVMDQPNLASLFYGPVLLAVEEASSLSDWRRVALPASDLASVIEGDPSALRFRIGELRLKPFFETYERCSAYLNVVEP